MPTPENSWLRSQKKPLDNRDRFARAEIEALLSRFIGLNAASLGTMALTKIVTHKMKELGFNDATTYWQYLKASPQGREDLIEASVVAETSFFRHPAAFDYLRRHVEIALPRSQFWRILSLPCSTGEEPYSIAMTLLEAGLPPESFAIDAVDISTIALTKARQGIYDPYSFRKSTTRFLDPYLYKYFRLGPGGYAIAPEVRSQVRFYRDNLVNPWCLHDRPSYDVIFCRNLLIYLHPSARDRAIDNLYRLLLPNGLLFAGYAETRLISARGFTSLGIPHAFAYRPLPQPSNPSISPPSPPQQRINPPAIELPVVPSLLPQTKVATQTVSEAIEIRALADRGLLSEALKECKLYLKTQPTSGEAYLLLGEILLAQGMDEKAESCLQKALFLNPRCEEALAYLILICEIKGDGEAAKRLQQRLDRAIEAN